MPIKYLDEETQVSPPSLGGGGIRYLEEEETVPLSDEEIISIVGNPLYNNPTFDEYAAFRAAKDRQDIPFRDYLPRIVDAGGMVLSELWSGVKEFGKMGVGAAEGDFLPTIGEAFVRGTTDLELLARKGIFDRAGRLMDSATGRGPEHDYHRFLANKQIEFMREKARRGDSSMLEYFGFGKGYDINRKAAEAASYILDPTLAIGGWGTLGKGGAKIASKGGAALESVAGAAAGGRYGLQAAKDLTSDLGQAVAERTGFKSLGTIRQTLGAVPLVGGGNIALSAGIYAPELLGVMATGTRVLEQVGKQLKLGPSQFSVLERIIADETLDMSVRKGAQLLYLGGYGQAVFNGMGSVAVGAGLGVGIGGTLGFLAEGEEGAIAGIGAGGAIGGVGGAIGAGLSKVIDTPVKRIAEDKDIEAFVQAQVKQGMNEVTLRKLDRNTLLQAATLKGVNTGSTKVNLASKNLYDRNVKRIAAERGFKEDAVGAALYDKNTDTIWVNLEDKFSRWNMLHEFGHALFYSPVINKSNLKTEIVNSYSAEAWNRMGDDYARSFWIDKEAESLGGRVTSEVKDKVTFKEPDSPANIKHNERVRKRLDDQKQELTRDVDPDWLQSEVFAEEFASLTINENINRLRKGQGFVSHKMDSIKREMLDAKASIYQLMGYPVNQFGEITSPSLIFGNVASTPKMQRIIKNYMKDRSSYHEGMSKRTIDDGVVLSVEDMANHPAAGWRSRGDGTFETDFAIKDSKGRVTRKDGDAIGRSLYRRAKDVEGIVRGTKDTPIDRDDPILGFKAQDDGVVKATGTVIPKEFYDLDSFGDEAKANMQVFENAIGLGTTFSAWYQQLSTSKSGKRRPKKEIDLDSEEYTSKMWTRNLNRNLGNIRASQRQFKPIGFLMSGEGNLSVTLVDIGMVREKMRRWNTELDANGRKKLADWGGSTIKFEQDMMVYLKNQGEAKPGATGIGEHKRDIFRAFFQSGSEGVNPLGDIYRTTSFDRGSMIKDFRVDRLQNVKPTEHTGFHFDYYRIKNNLIPSTRNISQGAGRKVDVALTPKGDLVDSGFPVESRIEADQQVAQVGDAFVSTAPGILRIPAWHASRSEFDKFSTDFAGSGQGAEVFGWGLYFGDSKRGVKKYYDEFAGADFISGKDEASLYEVDLKIEPSELVDWSIPLNKQKNILSKLGNDKEVEIAKNFNKPLPSKNQKFVDWYRQLEDMFTQEHIREWNAGAARDRRYGSRKASEYLASKGIKGITFSSKRPFSSDKKANPSDGFVVFDANDINIKTRNGERITPKQAANLMPRASSQTTQRGNTVSTYEKAFNVAKQVNEVGGKRVLDYAAGLGAGTKALRRQAAKIESYEPLPSERWMDDQSPTYTEAEKISGKYDTVLNLNTLNVLEPGDRDMVVRHIGEVLEEDGVAVIQARDSRSVMKANGRPGDEPNSVWIEKNFRGEKVEDYQKGFEQKELEEYVKDTLGLGFNVNPARGLSGVAVTAQKKMAGVALMPRGMFTRQQISELNKVTGKGYKKAFSIDWVQSGRGGKLQDKQKVIAGVDTAEQAQKLFDNMVARGKAGATGSGVVKNFNSQKKSPSKLVELPVLTLEKGVKFPKIKGAEKTALNPGTAEGWDRVNNMIDMGVSYANTLPHKGLSDAEWRKVAPVMFYGTGSKVLPPAPARLATWVKSPDAFRDFVVDAARENPMLLDSAVEGLNSLNPIHDMAMKGQIPKRMVALHMFWGIMSRMLGPFDQEGGWARLVGDERILDTIDSSLEGKYKLSEDEWKAFVSEGMASYPDVKVGRNATANANAYHLMLNKWNGRWDELTGIVNQTGFSGPQMRRSFFREGFGGAGIKHKVVSFVLATLARKDLFIGDRWQVVNFWMPHLQRAATARGKSGGDKHVFKYNKHGIPEDTTQAYKTYGPMLDKPGIGEGVYSIIENALETIAEQSRPWLEPILGRRPEAFDIHWITWNTIKKEPVGHSSLDSTSKYLQEGKYDIPNYTREFAGEPKSTERYVPGTEGQFDRFTVAGRDRPEFSTIERAPNEAIRQLGQRTDETVQARPSLIPQFTERPGFQNWFGRSKVTESDGVTPLVLFHGTTHEFSQFKKGEKGHRSDENDFGNGNYFTSSPEDASRNYAGVGPDRQIWIERRAEELESEYGIDYDLALQQAKAMLEGDHQGAVIPAYLRMENPLKVDKSGGTFFEFETIFDGDEIVDEVGRGIELIDTIRDVADRYDQEGIELFDDPSKIVDELSMTMLDNQGVSANEAAQAIRKFATGQFAQDVFAQMGFDGIIDSTVSSKFKSMNIRPGTKHYIAFESDQIKGALNPEFDASKPDWNLMPRGGMKEEKIGSSKVLSKGQFKAIETKAKKWRVYGPGGKLIGVSGTEKQARSLIAKKSA